MDNKIKLFEKNTKNLAVYVLGLSYLSSFTPYLTVKRKTTDVTTLLSKAGYDVVLESSTLGNHTLVRNKFSIL